METFQYSIFFIDYIIAWSLSAVLVVYASSWLTPMRFIILCLNRFAQKYLVAILTILFTFCILGAFFLTAIFGLYIFKYENMIFTFMVAVLAITRGTIAHLYVHPYLSEDYEYYITRVGVIFTIMFIFLFHIIIRYFIINLSVASFFSEFTLTRKELYEKRMKSDLKKLEKLELEKQEEKRKEEEEQNRV